MRAWRRPATVAKAATTLCQNAAAQTTFAAAQLTGTQRLHVWQAQRAWPGSCNGTELRLPRSVRTAVSKRAGQQLSWVSFTSSGTESLHDCKFAAGSWQGISAVRFGAGRRARSLVSPTEKRMRSRNLAKTTGVTFTNDVVPSAWSLL